MRQLNSEKNELAIDLLLLDASVSPAAVASRPFAPIAIIVRRGAETGITHPRVKPDRRRRASLSRRGAI
jgi:hypothetical protein